MPGKVLIADPNLDTCTNLEALLRERSYEVYSVSSGKDVLPKVYEFQPNIILLSVIMPEQTGYEICSFIKNNSELKDIVVVLTFSENDAFDYPKARQAGATRFLPKSVEPALLISILSFILAGDSSLIKYSKPLFGSYSVAIDSSNPTNEPEIEEMEAIDDMEEIEVMDDIEEIEAIDDMEEIEVMGDIEDDEERIDTVEIELSNSYDYEIEQDSNSPVTEQPLANTSDTNNEIPVENTLVENTTIENIPLEQSPSLEPPVDLIDRATGNLELFFDPPIVEGQFEYHEEDSEDPLQINQELNSISCRECGATILAEDVFCVECGAAVDETAVQVPTDSNCDSCGQIVSLGDVFCLNCGAVQ